MPLSPDIWPKIVNYSRNKLLSLFNPSRMFIEQDDLRDNLNINHKGFYVGIIDSSSTDIVREGFLQDEQTNVLDSINIILNNIYSKLNASGVTAPTVETSTFYFSMIDECMYMKNPLQWDEGSDGICFQWGQKYLALYLPYQINRSSHTKYEIMDRLCSFEAGIVSNAWKLPEGLCYRLIVDSFSG